MIAVLFAVLFALALVIPVSDLVALPAVYELYGIGAAVPWGLLIAAVASPPVCYLLGLVLGRGRPAFDRALILTVALAASFALHLSISTWVAALQPAL